MAFLQYGHLRMMDRIKELREENERLQHERDAADAAAERTLQEVERLRNRVSRLRKAVKEAGLEVDDDE
jgi:predicted  nucleic acid-binding Zn-ribbon protein